MAYKKFTWKQMRDIKDAWKTLQQDKEEFYRGVKFITKWLAKETGIDDIEFIIGCDGEFCGVGTTSRSHKSVQMDEKGNIVK